MSMTKRAMEAAETMTVRVEFKLKTGEWAHFGTFERTAESMYGWTKDLKYAFGQSDREWRMVIQ